jgi:4-aminobutyrate aminotransferase-like enzyme
MHGQLPIVWDRAENYSVFDAAGNRWIDFTSTIFVTNIGHGNEALREAVKECIDKPLLATYVYPNVARANYIKSLVEFAGKGFEKAFLLSAGTETTEAATKLMKMHGRSENKKRNLVVSVTGNWHGRTMGAQLLSSNEVQKSWINSQDSETVQIPFPYPWEVSEKEGADFARKSFNDLESKGISIESDICGIILETFQGWAAAFYPKSYVQEIRRICDESRILLCFDEMQSGFGRTGKNFGYEHYEVNADLLCCGKGMGGGLPLSGVIGTKKIMDLPDVGNMSSTHSGNPIMVTAGIAVLNEIQKENLVFESKRKGEILHQELSRIKGIHDDLISSIQGIGLIAAVIFNLNARKDMNSFVSRIAELCMQKGLLVVHTGRESIKIGPPLTISDAALLEGLSVLQEAILEVSTVIND